METFTIEYSTKNIPQPSKHEYKIKLISKVESVIKRMRWKTLEFLGKLDSTRQETYGFTSCKCPPTVEELSDFENELLFFVKNIEFRNINNSFQKNLNDDIKSINTPKKVLVKADKSRNIYQLDKDDYKKYLRENITTTYKKLANKRLNPVNKQAKKIAEKLNVDGRVEKIQKSEACITVKYHKTVFPNNPSFRLINPSKSNIGKISKKILDKINQKVIQETKVNQWKNTNAVIVWFSKVFQIKAVYYLSTLISRVFNRQYP